MTTSPVMAWLADGVPLSLLCDLAAPAGPASLEICSVERPAHDPIWREAARAGSDLVARWEAAG